METYEYFERILASYREAVSSYTDYKFILLSITAEPVDDLKYIKIIFKTNFSSRIAKVSAKFYFEAFEDTTFNIVNELKDAIKEAVSFL